MSEGLGVERFDNLKAIFTSTEVVETPGTNKYPSQEYTHPDEQ